MESTITLIGGGRMAEAIIAGLCRNPDYNGRIRVGEPDAERRRVLAERYGVDCLANNQAVVDGAGMVVLAVKPQLAAAVCPKLRAEAGQLWLSILAGTPVGVLREWLGPAPTIGRAMPNTPALAGRGVTGLYLPDGTGAEQTRLARAAADSLGSVFIVDSEERLDALTTVSGCGPAYYFAFTEALAEAGRAQGLDADIAEQLARETLVGAAALLEQTGESPAELRRQVTSPGGATAAALAAFADGGLGALVNQAAAAARKRTEELARGEA